MAAPNCPGARLGDGSQRSQRPKDFGSYPAPRTPVRAGEAKWRGARCSENCGFMSFLEDMFVYIYNYIQLVSFHIISTNWQVQAVPKEYKCWPMVTVIEV